MIISFAHTSEALISGNKTVTRRQWASSHARKFHGGQIVQAWDRLPRTGRGRRIALIEITEDPYLERLGDMPESDLEAEGGLWDSRQDFIDAFGGDPDLMVWVIRFKLLELSRQWTIPLGSPPVS